MGVKSGLYASVGEVQISVFKSFKLSLLPCKVKHFHDAKQLHLSLHSSAFTASSRFELLFKHSTIPCTTDHLSMILAVLKDGPTEVPKQHHHFASRRYPSEFFGPG
jgi:hypothetical protein